LTCSFFAFFVFSFFEQIKKISLKKKKKQVFDPHFPLSTFHFPIPIISHSYILTLTPAYLALLEEKIPFVKQKPFVLSPPFFPLLRYFS
jgi:hypothetical protein